MRQVESLRRFVRRRLLLAADHILSLLERQWIEVAGGRRRRRKGANVDPSTGRTSVERLRENALGDQVWPRLQEALDRGVDEAEVAVAFNEATDRAAELVGRALRRRRSQMLREHRSIRRGMERRIRALWGSALDALYEIHVVSEEIGSELQQLHGDQQDLLIQALLGLHARGCLVVSEVHSLLAHGFPLGALARTRSLHEAAVFATILAHHGREHITKDLGDRFLAHAVVDQAKDLELAVKSGVEIDPEDLAAVRRERDDAVARFGAGFGHDYGWARPLFPTLGPKERVTFARLEELADTGLARLNYRYGGHHVHSSAWTLVLNTLSRAGKSFRLTGPTNVLFAEPAALALAGIITCTAAVVQGVAMPLDPYHLVAIRTLEHLAARANRLFAEAEELVDRRETRLQARHTESS